MSGLVKNVISCNYVRYLQNVSNGSISTKMDSVYSKTVIIIVNTDAKLKGCCNF